MRNFETLEGLCELRQLDLEAFEARCRGMYQDGYRHVYFSDLFFAAEPADTQTDESRILWREPTMAIVARTNEQLLAIRDVLDRTGMTPGGAHFLQSMPKSGQAPETILPLHRRLLEMAALVGITRVTTHAGWRLPGSLEQDAPSHEKMYEDSLVAYRALCQEAAKHGINVAIETACQSWSWLDENPKRLCEFIDNVNEKNLGICFDCGHLFIAGLELATAFREMGTYVCETHYHDNDGATGGTFVECDLHNPIGKGKIDWPALIAAMRDANYAGMITFEQNDYQTNSKQWRYMLEKVQKGAA